MDAFPYEDRSLKKDPLPHRKPAARLRRTGVMWSRRRAPDTINRPQYSVLTAAVIPVTCLAFEEGSATQRISFLSYLCRSVDGSAAALNS